MKKFIATTVTATILVFFATASFAQSTQEDAALQPQAPKWVPEKGYWVIESNIKTPTEQTVYYYSNNNVLVYQQTVSGKKLDINKRKIKMQLKKDLEAYITAWQGKQKDRKEDLASNQ